MKKLAYKPAEANRTFGVLRKMFNLAEVWGLRPDGTNPCRHVPMYPPGKKPGSSWTMSWYGSSVT